MKNMDATYFDVPAGIAVLPELTSGGVQMDLTHALVRKSQSLQYGDKKVANNSMWRITT